MKLWRKQAMKAGKRTGRKIRHQSMMEEIFFRKMPKTYPLLNQLFIKAGVPIPRNPLIDQLARMAEKEAVDETK